MRLIWNNPYLRFVLLVVAAGVVLWVVRSLSGVVIAFLVAFLFAYLLNPIVDRIERRSNRALGVLAMVFGLLGLFGLLWLLGLSVSGQLSGFLIRLPLLLETIQELPYRIARTFDPRFDSLFQAIYVNLERLSRLITEQLLPQLTTVAQGGTEGTLQTLVRIGSNLAQVFIIFILTLYLLFNFPKYSRSFLRVFPHRYRATAEEIVTTAGASVGAYVRGQIFIAFCVGVMTFVGLWLIGVPLALALGVFAGVANLIPFLGPILAAIPTAFLGLTESPTHMIGALAVLIIANQVDGNVLTPIIFSRVIALDPVSVLVSILVGAALFGFVGALLAVPVAAFLKVMFVTYYLESNWYRSAGGPPPS